LLQAFDDGARKQRFILDDKHTRLLLERLMIRHSINSIYVCLHLGHHSYFLAANSSRTPSQPARGAPGRIPSTFCSSPNWPLASNRVSARRPLTSYSLSNGLVTLANAFQPLPMLYWVS